MSPLLNDIARWLTRLYTLDRLLKLLAVWHFFRQPAPPAPSVWPSVSLIQPITRGASDLHGVLQARTQLDYSGPLQHILVCDRADGATQAVVQGWLPQLGGTVRLVVMDPDGGVIASKVAKLQAGLEHAHSETLIFVDDDVQLRPDSLRRLVSHLHQPAVGAVFGLACYTAWDSVWSSLMSVFVNANAVLSYIPLTYLTAPYTITGHLFAVRRAVFDAVGGLHEMTQRLDDDHELARRVRRHGLRCVQTGVIYDIRNDMPTPGAFSGQLKRWFTFPRLLMAPWLTRREQAVSLLGSIGTLIPGLVTILALVTRTRDAWRSLGVCLGLFSLGYALGEQRLGRRTPMRRWPLLPLMAVITPFQVVWAWLGDDVVLWRGQRLRVRQGGEWELAGTEGSQAK